MQLKYLWIASIVSWSVLGVAGVSVRPMLAAEAAAEVTSSADVHADAAHQATHGDGEAGGINPVTFDPDLAIVTAIIFLVLLAVLWKFAWGPIVQALDKREHTVAEQLADAKRSQDEAKRLLVEHEQRMAGTAAEVKQLLDQARRDAEIQKQQILETAQAAAVAEKDRAVREIDAAKNAALSALAKKSVDTAVDLAGQIVRRQLNADDHSQLIGDALQQFSHDN